MGPAELHEVGVAGGQLDLPLAGLATVAAVFPAGRRPGGRDLLARTELLHGRQRGTADAARGLWAVAGRAVVVNHDRVAVAVEEPIPSRIAGLVARLHVDGLGRIEVGQNDVDGMGLDDVGGHIAPRIFGNIAARARAIGRVRGIVEDAGAVGRSARVGGRGVVFRGTGLFRAAGREAGKKHRGEQDFQAHRRPRAKQLIEKVQVDAHPFRIKIGAEGLDRRRRSRLATEHLAVVCTQGQRRRQPPHVGRGQRL